MASSLANRTQLITKHLTNAAKSIMADAKHPITLYTAQTPNGVKVSILLEELGLPYNVRTISFDKTEQKEPWFLEINPNGRIPALTDSSFDNGKGINLMESGSILQYLVETYDKDHKISFPHGSAEYWEVQQWVFFQNAGVGPMQGQANHFFRYAPEKIPYGINRYQTETSRLYGVLNTRLEQQAKKGSSFLVGNKLTIADITTYGWVRAAGWAGVDIENFPALKKWEELLDEREGFKKGRDVPTPNRIKEMAKDEEAAKREAAKASAWIMKKD
ncbi:glutathione S-transferase [Pyronema omphalodes]|nr:glutathione S-transferase [Pyronema omphalodes]